MYKQFHANTSNCLQFRSISFIYKQYEAEVRLFLHVKATSTLLRQTLCNSDQIGNLQL